MKKLLTFFGCFFMVFGLSMVINIGSSGINFNLNNVKGATITPESKPYKDYGVTSKNYNKQRKHSYLIQSYLKAFEDNKKGGTLYLTKGSGNGVYTLSNEMCIPSNVKIVIKDGVTVKKTYDAGVSKDGNEINASTYMFSFVPISLRSSGAVKRGSGNATENSSIIGEGSATIDAGGATSYKNGGQPYCGTIAFGDNTNCKVSGITFKNMNKTYGHFMEVNGTADCIIENNTFIGGTTAIDENGNKVNAEAINIDTFDNVKKGFSGKWLAPDGTRNIRLKIRNNKFSDMNIAIGTHGYTHDNPHKQVEITGNTFTNIYSKVIQPMRWKETVISGNTFNCSPENTIIYCRSANVMDVYNNTFNVNNASTRIYHFRYAYHQSGSTDKLKVEPVANNITAENKENMLHNNTYNGTYFKNIYFRTAPIKVNGVYTDPKDANGKWIYDDIWTLD